MSRSWRAPTYWGLSAVRASGPTVHIGQRFAGIIHWFLWLACMTTKWPLVCGFLVAEVVGLLSARDCGAAHYFVHSDHSCGFAAIEFTSPSLLTPQYRSVVLLVCVICSSSDPCGFFQEERSFPIERRTHITLCRVR